MQNANNKKMATASIEFWKSRKRFHDLCQSMKENGKCNEILLFGSVARGEETENSDIDFAFFSKSKHISEMLEIIESFKNISKLAHVVFFPVGMKNKILSQGGLPI